MLFNKNGVIFFFAALFSAVSYADVPSDGKDYNKFYEDCVADNEASREGMPTEGREYVYDANQCNYEVKNLSENEINILYKRSYENLINNPDEQKSAAEFKSAHEHWLAFRKDYCKVYSKHPLGGFNSELECMAELNVDYVKQLRHLDYLIKNIFVPVEY